MKSKVGSVAIFALLIAALVWAPGYRDVVETVNRAAADAVVVLDPGHGGIDGGAESSDGMSEKDINLAIAAELKKELEKKNIQVILTRDEDEGLYDKSQKGAIRSLKTQDMQARREVIDKADADLAVSIHLNSFTQDTSVRGAQVFYPSAGEESLTGESKKAAELIQEGLNKDINVTMSRSALGKSDVYLLQNITCPIVIVECGFLSNPVDAQNLKKSGHQKKIVKSMLKSICTYLEKN